MKSQRQLVVIFSVCALTLYAFYNPLNPSESTKSSKPVMFSAHMESVPVYASLLADSHALSTHWVYDTELIAKIPIKILKESLGAPELTKYHPGKRGGDHTHYGDQTIILLNSLSKNKPFDATKFEKMWRDEINGGFKGYKDHATLDTLKRGKGSDSTDLGGVSRITPLLLVSKTETEFVHNAIAQTAVTHNTSILAGAASFMAHCLWRLIHSSLSPSAVIPAVAEELQPHYPDVIALVRKGIEAVNLSSEDFSRSVGKSCGVNNALPLVVQIVLKGETGSVIDALVVNALIGGDTAARSMLISPLISIRNGLPVELVKQLNQYSMIESKIKQLE